MSRLLAGMTMFIWGLVYSSVKPIWINLIIGIVAWFIFGILIGGRD